jgi:hypothetical protein
MKNGGYMKSKIEHGIIRFSIAFVSVSACNNRKIIVRYIPRDVLAKERCEECSSCCSTDVVSSWSYIVHLYHDSFTSTRNFGRVCYGNISFVSSSVCVSDS